MAEPSGAAKGRRIVLHWSREQGAGSSFPGIISNPAKKRTLPGHLGLALVGNNHIFKDGYYYYFVFLSQSLIMQFRLILISVCNPGCSQIHKDPPASCLQSPEC